MTVEQARARYSKKVTLAIHLDAVDIGAIDRLREIAERHKGTCPCYFSITPSGALPRQMTLQSTTGAVTLSREFIREIEQIIGANNIMISS